MIIWALLTVLLLDLSLGTPLRGLDDDGKYGYQYDVKHPAGSSRVHVSSGSDHNKNYYPSSIHHGDYISDSSYNDPTYVGPVYRQDRDRHYPKSYNEGPSYGQVYSKVPVYEEHTYPRAPVYRSAPTQSYYPTYDNYGSHGGPSVISQSNVNAGSLYQKPAAGFDRTYSKPQFVQQVSIQEPEKFEQVSYEPIVQKTLSKVISRPSSYPLVKSQAPSYSKYEQAPIDQQIIIDKQSPIEQQVVVEVQSPIDQQVLVDAPSPFQQKVFDDKQSPIDQQVIVDEQAPIDQKVIIEEQSPVDQQIVIDEPKEIILQKSVEEKPEISQISIDIPTTKNTPKIKGAPIVQQSSFDVSPPANIGKKTPYIANKPPVVQQVVVENPYPVTKKSPISQKTIEHPSQAAYDSPIEPYFSDVDRHAPPQLYKTPPRYRIVPTGPPYEKISHFTKIVHAPPRPFYPPQPYYPPQRYPQKHIKTVFPVYKKPPLSYSIKYPPPPPPPRPVTKTILPYSQKAINTNIFTKNPPVSPYIKSPPVAPAIKTSVPSAVQYHVDPPISQSIKLPPPAPITKSVKLPPPAPITKSIKLPPPAPITKSIKSPVLAQVQENVDVLLVKNPPVVQTVKSPPPAPATKTIIQQVQEYADIPPPPAPITKTLTQADLPKSQEYVDADIPSSKNYPAPATKTIAAAPISQSQQYVDEDILTIKSPVSQTVKLPPPPVTKSTANTKVPPPVTKSIPNTKLPQPPVTKSVAPTKQESVDDEIVSKTYPEISQSIKTSPISQKSVPVVFPSEQKYVDIPSTKNAPYSVKQPPVQIHQPITFENPTYVKEPYRGQKSVGASQPKLPSVVSYFNKPQYRDPVPPAPVKNSYSAPPVLSNKNAHYSDSELHLYVPSTKNSPPSVKYPTGNNAYSVKQPVKSGVTSSSPNTQHVNPHFSALLSADGKGSDPSSSLKQPYSPSPQYESKDTSYPEDGPIKKYTPDFDDGPYSDSVHEEGYGSNVPPDSSHLDEPVEEKSPFDKYSPVSHAVRLPSIIPSAEVDDKHTIDGIGESSPLDKYPPVSHSIILPIAPKATPVPNLFAAVPPQPTDSNGDTSDLSHDSPKSEALVRPLSHSVRLPLPIQGNNYKSREKSDESKEKFPAFPVESALNHPDPVADKVAELSNSFTPGEGYDNSHSPPNDPDAPSIEEARAEIDRLNREIGRPFGSRLARRSNSVFVRIR